MFYNPELTFFGAIVAFLSFIPFAMGYTAAGDAILGIGLLLVLIDGTIHVSHRREVT